MGSRKKRNQDRKVKATVQIMKEVVNCSEEEIYAMLVKCNMDADEAISRLLSQERFQEVKSKRGKKKEAKEKSRKDERDEEDYKVPVDFEEAVQNVQEIVKCSEQEIKTMLIECNMDADKAANRLLSQDTIQQVKSNQDEKKETEDISESQRVGSSNQNRELSKGGDNYVGQGGGNKFNSVETSNVQRIRNHLAGSSTTAGILGPGPPLNRDVLNAETKRVPTSSGEAVPSLSVPSSRLIPAWGFGTSGQRTMADVVKMAIASSKESVTKATVKDDYLLPEKPVVSNPSSNSFIESAARRDQLREPASVSIQNFRDGEDGDSQLMCDNYKNKNDETCQVQRCSSEHNQTKDPTPPVNLDQCTKELEHLRLGRFGSGINGSGEHSGLPSQFLNDDSEDIPDSADGGSQLLCDNYNNTNDETYQMQRCSSEHNQTKDLSTSIETNLQQLPIDNNEPKTSVKELQRLKFGSFGSGMNRSVQPSGLQSGFLNCEASEDISNSADELSFSYLNTRDGECHEDEDQRLWSNVGNDQTEPSQYESSSATDFTFDNSQLVKFQMQNINTFPAMRQQACIREADPEYSASPHNQSMPTASSLGPRLSVSMPKTSICEPQMDQQSMNHHYYQPMVTSGNNGDMMNNPYSQPTQNDTYNISPSAVQKHGGRNINCCHLRSVTAPLPHGRNSVLPPSTVPIPSAHSSAYGSTNGSTYGFGMPSDNATNSRCGYDDVFSSQFSNHLATLQQQHGTSSMWTFSQNGTSNMWTPQGLSGSGNKYYSLYSGPQNQQSQSFRHSQQQQQQQGQDPPYRIRTGYENESSSAYGSTNGSAYNSAYGVDMVSDNTANLRFDYKDDFHTRFSNHLASLQRQNGNSNMLTPQRHNDSGRNYSSTFPVHQNQQSPSFRHSQQPQHQEQEQTYTRIGYGNEQEESSRRIGNAFENAFERSRRYYASLDQQNNRRGDPSNQTQQQQWPRNNN